MAASARKITDRTPEASRPPLTRENLYLLVACSVREIGLSEIIKHFSGDDLESRAGEFLSQLCRKGTLIKNDKGYKAKKSWANVCYARPLPAEPGAKRTALELINAPKGTPVTASVSSEKLRKARPGKNDVLFVELSRLKGFELGARILGSCKPGEPVIMSGRISLNSGSRLFEPGNNSIKGRFNISAGSRAQPSHGTLCQTRLPLNFKISDPVVEIHHRLDEDAVTGAKITDVVAKKHRIHNGPSRRAEDEAAHVKYWRINRSRRTDLTDLDIITVDPPGAPDRDDGFCVEETGDGFRLVTVIADVPYYVRHNMHMDRDAYERGNTIYMPDKTHHMLPGDIVTKASITRGEDRPVYFVESFYDDAGLLIPGSAHIGLGVVNSKAQLSYGEFADMIIRGNPLVSRIEALHRAMRERVDNEDAHVAQELLRDDPTAYASKSLVETFMVQTNGIIAGQLHDSGIPALYRNNGPTIDAYIYDRTVEILADLGLELPADPEQCTWDVLDRIILEARAAGISARVEPLLMENLLDRAYYSPVNRGHFSLKLQHYMHATSPIRRYADVINLRAVRTMIGARTFGLAEEEIANLSDTASHLNARKQREKNIAVDIRRYHAVADLEPLKGQTIRAIVLGVHGQHIEILLPRNGLRTRITIEDLRKDGFEVDTARREIIHRPGTKEEKRFGRTSNVRGTVGKVSATKAKWEFHLVEPA